jgi:hypothetical protein
MVFSFLLVSFYVDGSQRRQLTFVSGKPACGDGHKNVSTTQAPKAFPAVCPLYIASEHLREMGSYSYVTFHLDHLNNSTLANGSADPGRKRFSVNFVSCPG